MVFSIFCIFFFDIEEAKQRTSLASLFCPAPAGKWTQYASGLEVNAQMSLRPVTPFSRSHRKTCVVSSPWRRGAFVKVVHGCQVAPQGMIGTIVDHGAFGAPPPSRCCSQPRACEYTIYKIYKMAKIYKIYKI